MNRKWKILSILYVVLTAPLAHVGACFSYYVWMHHMFIIGLQKPSWLP